jgi:hypothetical protein
VSLSAIELCRVEIRTVAGPSSAKQCVLSGGPSTVASQLRHVQVVGPPPVTEARLITHEHLAGAEGVAERSGVRSVVVSFTAQWSIAPNRRPWA